jgi:flagellar biosynthesis/type III secretory pathway chaperone
MKPPEDWFDQFFTEEQHRKLARVDQRQTLDQKKGVAEALKAFFSEVKQHLHQDVQDNEVQGLVDRWEALISELTLGDPRLAASLDRAYAEAELSAPPEVQNWLGDIEDAVRFIRQAQAARHNPN